MDNTLEIRLNGRPYVAIKLSDDDLELSPAEIAERFIVPAIQVLLRNQRTGRGLINEPVVFSPPA